MKHYLSVADFIVIFDLVDKKIENMEQLPLADFFDFGVGKSIEEKKKEHLEKLKTDDAYYQRLLKIRKHLGNLNIDIDVPKIKVKGE